MSADTRVCAVLERVPSVAVVGRRASEARRTRRPATGWLRCGACGALGGSAGGEAAHLLADRLADSRLLGVGVLEDQRHRLGGQVAAGDQPLIVLLD